MDTDQLQAIGIIPEQHPDRTVLFNQWKRLDMDLLVDPLNRLDVAAVPIVLFVDEHGVIRYRNPRPEDLEPFLRTRYAAPVSVSPSNLPGSRWQEGDASVMAGRVDEAIKYYRDQLREHPDDARLHFRLGVARRIRYDSASGHEGDFVQAIEQWRLAREIDPNQYIWRRRIQQYGPVLDKPYPFYRWVKQARQELLQRGETPHPLTIEPSGAELARPSSKDQVEATDATEPDPQAKLHRDNEQAIIVQTVIVRSTNFDQRAVRIHFLLYPNPHQGHVWNNEAEPLQIWIDVPAGVHVAEQLLEVQNRAEATSTERRQAEVEVTWDTTRSGPIELSAYAIYNVCQKRTGVCIIRRQDISVRWEASVTDGNTLEGQ